MRRYLSVAIMAVLLLTAAPAVAAPHEVARTWITLRCALCHGLDGAGQTNQGQSLKAPDLRTARVQKKTNDVLAHFIMLEHSRIAGLRSQLNTEKLKHLITHIRSLEKRP